MDKHIKLVKIQFFVLAALVVVATGFLAQTPAISPNVRFLIPLGAIALLMVLVFRFGKQMTAERPKKETDVFDHTDKDTNPAVLGKLAELKYGGKKRRTRFEDDYKV